MTRRITNGCSENETSAHILKQAEFVFTETIEMDLSLRKSNEYELNL